MKACFGGTDVMERSCAVVRGEDINSKGASYGQLGAFRGALDAFTLDNPRPRQADNFWCFRNLGLPTSSAL
jgi:hypothetical protein